ncbi:UDP-N-acetylmuramoyl-L-alanine--D-glutamate ligase [Sphingomonas sp. SUN019]|uniref:UDP-N-acetylmuramoyl-L-alanine--D-glutamate ligase n=1 Tax=Sphingomonas sp. SUN019 TaxID=2937788 RepID=UPI0021645AFB|nr:UDP-N-acetylmuramoyl-L-alanine--D-glutamate ligase [Sphingomonas sp. SUN019]UVO51792.1 UDP-N-acetylmuramoyl-L-alanine--D-glutamate ligase [Sphingomonas sp. SUN019]
MITSRAWNGKRYVVLGLARSGAAVLNALMESGARVVAWDSDATRVADVKAHFGAQDDPAGEGMNFLHSGARLEIVDPMGLDLSAFDALVVSPGVPLNTHPLAAKARDAGVAVIGDIELFAQSRAELRPHKVVGITGTNGKSTTTALVHHILQTAGVPSLMGGNIGLPILEQEPLPEGGVYVLELSSYQIDLTQTLDCDVAVLLNVTPDHLDRYSDFQAYADSKARLFAMQSPEHEAVIAIGDAASAQIARGLSARGEHLTKIAPGVCMDQSRWPSLQGPHNAQNALAAISVCQALGVSEADIDRGLQSFKGLPHRMEQVGVVNGVAYVDDSKATNPESTAPALAAFSRVHWIVGGRAKGDDLDACRPAFGHVVRAYTIGEAGPVFAAVLEGDMPVERAGTLAEAVNSAAWQAKAGDTVLLSPAAASFDQFRDYEHRGQAFKDAVGALQCKTGQ